MVLHSHKPRFKSLIVTRGYCVGQCSYRTLPSLQKVLLDCASYCHLNIPRAPQTYYQKNVGGYGKGGQREVREGEKILSLVSNIKPISRGLNNQGSLSFKFIFLFRERERERERMGALGRDRGRGRERISSRLHVVSAEPNTGLDPMNHEIMI